MLAETVLMTADNAANATPSDTTYQIESSADNLTWTLESDGHILTTAHTTLSHTEDLTFRANYIKITLTGDPANTVTVTATATLISD